MAKKKAEVPEQEPETTSIETDSSSGTPHSGNGGTVAGYFRPIFAENPGLLKERSNEFLYQKWLQDHPGESVVPQNVRQCLSNLKSVLRQKLSAKRDRPRKEVQPTQDTTMKTTPRPRPAMAKLEQLEQSIDDSLALAKQIDREGLHDIIRLLRTARNRLVMQMGGD